VELSSSEREAGRFCIIVECQSRQVPMKSNRTALIVEVLIALPQPREDNKAGYLHSGNAGSIIGRETHCNSQMYYLCCRLVEGRKVACRIRLSYS